MNLETENMVKALAPLPRIECGCGFALQADIPVKELVNYYVTHPHYLAEIEVQ